MRSIFVVAITQKKPKRSDDSFEMLEYVVLFVLEYTFVSLYLAVLENFIFSWIENREPYDLVGTLNR